MPQLTGPLGAYAGGNTADRTTVANTALGATAQDGSGAEYRYVKAGAAIAQYDAVTFTGTALGFDSVIPTTDLHEVVVGVAQVAFASGDYGWILTKGIGSVKTTGSVAIQTTLVASATDGTLATQAATDTGPTGAVVLVNSASPQVCYITGI